MAAESVRWRADPRSLDLYHRWARYPTPITAAMSPMLNTFANGHAEGMANTSPSQSQLGVVDLTGVGEAGFRRQACSSHRCCARRHDAPVGDDRSRVERAADADHGNARQPPIGEDEPACECDPHRSMMVRMTRKLRSSLVMLWISDWSILSVSTGVFNRRENDE